MAKNTFTLLVGVEFAGIALFLRHFWSSGRLRRTTNCFGNKILHIHEAISRKEKKHSSTAIESLDSVAVLRLLWPKINIEFMQTCRNIKNIYILSFPPAYFSIRHLARPVGTRKRPENPPIIRYSSCRKGQKTAEKKCHFFLANRYPINR